MESKFSFTFTKRADTDLDGIATYISLELCNPKAASDFMDKLETVIEETCTFPESGVLVDNEFLSGTDIRKKMIGNYIMYYLPDFAKKRIFILRIIYAGRNMDVILRQFDL